jgi:uncharacterized coiled-coil protein SlyX
MPTETKQQTLQDWIREFLAANNRANAKSFPYGKFRECLNALEARDQTLAEISRVLREQGEEIEEYQKALAAVGEALSLAVCYFAEENPDPARKEGAENARGLVMNFLKDFPRARRALGGE